jgi:hypothetical protein
MAGGADVSDDWEAQVMAAWDEFAGSRLGPDIARDAKRYCPEDTGSLKDSIENHLEQHDLIVSATGGAGGRVYAAYVELGHRVAHPSTGIVGPEVVPPEPFLRPALFQTRSE